MSKTNENNERPLGEHLATAENYDANKKGESSEEQHLMFDSGISTIIEKFKGVTFENSEEPEEEKEEEKKIDTKAVGPDQFLNSDLAFLKAYITSASELLASVEAKRRGGDNANKGEEKKVIGIVPKEDIGKFIDNEYWAQGFMVPLEDALADFN